jgi:N-acetyl-gamma-glutamylphosphate reductase
MEKSISKKIRVAIIGASGAIGREIIRTAQKNDEIAELTLLVRRRLPEWKQEDFKPRLNFIERENFDDISDLASELQGYDAFLCTLGSRVGTGKDNFKKVEL